MTGIAVFLAACIKVWRTDDDAIWKAAILTAGLLIARTVANVMHGAAT